MILLDTSIWIDYFRQQAAHLNEISVLLQSRQILAYEPVFSELFYGVRNKKELELVKSLWRILPKAPFDPGTILEASLYAQRNTFYQKGIGLMDACIMYAVVRDHALLWTLDKNIKGILDSTYLYQPGQYPAAT
jgi:predicted nucleic acid-binding protein